ncbi:MAG TPA: hypothetical protein VG734_21805 [Lacunisphaera sp.]|nr:hypothetical protein [Lacunisphaera sp.]
MSNRVRHFFVGLLLLASVRVASAAPVPWVQLKVGMDAGEILSLLGEPILRSAARGFEVWTYDDGAEVVVCGMVVGWTMPASVATAVRSQDIWRAHPKGDYLGTLRTALRKAGKTPVNELAKRPVQATRPPAPAMGYEEYSARG